mgnify:CR=1 FL=1
MKISKDFWEVSFEMKWLLSLGLKEFKKLIFSKVTLLFIKNPYLKLFGYLTAFLF